MNFLNLSQHALVLSKSYEKAQYFIEKGHKGFRSKVRFYLEKNGMYSVGENSLNPNIVSSAGGDGGIDIGISYSIENIDGVYESVISFYLESKKSKISLGNFIIINNDGNEIYWSVLEKKKINSYASFNELMEDGVGEGIINEEIVKRL